MALWGYFCKGYYMVSERLKIQDIRFDSFYKYEEMGISLKSPFKNMETVFSRQEFAKLSDAEVHSWQ